MPILDRATRLYLLVSRLALVTVACAMLVVMVGANAWNIVTRPFVETGIMWHQEVSILAAMWVYFAAYALTSKDDSYVRIAFLVERMGRRAERFFVATSEILVILFHGAVMLLTLKALDVVRWSETHVLELPETLFFVPLIVGSADLALTETIHLLRRWLGLASARLDPKPVAMGEGG